MRMARREPPEPTPICRCRVLYLGSAVPQVTKDGLQGIQEPLRELYPAEGAISAKGIDSWLSVWSNGLLLENVDENQKKVTKFFPIESLHYCAAVRYVVVSGGEGSSPMPRFLPLDSPFARNPSSDHPPLFACILRRTTGIKVLECHSFICKRETPANALVRCCFHAYADSMYAKSLEGGNASQYGSLYGGRATEEAVIEVDYTGDLSSVNSEILPTSVRSSPTQEGGGGSPTPGREDEMSIFNGDENHKVWAGPSKTETEMIYSEYGTGTLRSARSTSSLYGTAGPSKPSRPRQMVMPSVAPPPPPSSEPDKENKRMGKKETKHRHREEDELSRISNGVAHRPPSAMNGKRIPYNGSLSRPINGIPHPMNGSLLRNSNGHSSKPKGKFNKMFSSLSEKKNKGKRPPHPFITGPPPNGPLPPHMQGPLPPHMQGPLPPQMQGPLPPQMQGPLPPQMQGPLPPHMQGPLPPHLQGPVPPHMQGQPPHMNPHLGPLPPPPPHMMPQQGTLPPPMMMGPYGPMHPPPYGRRPHSRAAEEPIYMPSSRPLSPTASYQPGHFPHEQYLMNQYATTGRPKHKPKKKKKKGKEAIEDIYGRKGHLNERAFSHSIREEHRSQSFGSLVDLHDTQLTKKDKEMMQMVADLDLSGDELERVEARPGVYRPPRSEISGTVVSRGSRR